MNATQQLNTLLHLVKSVQVANRTSQLRKEKEARLIETTVKAS